MEPCGTPYFIVFTDDFVAVNIVTLFSIVEVRPKKLQLSIRNTIVVQFVE